MSKNMEQPKSTATYPYTNLDPNQSRICGNLNFRRRLPIRCKKWTCPIAIVILILYLHYFHGFFYRLLEQDFTTEFAYPDQITEFPTFLQHYKLMDEFNAMENASLNTTFRPEFKPSNELYSRIQFLRSGGAQCPGPLGVLIIVKSATNNFAKRSAIRSTWGHPSNLKNTSLSPDLPTKLVFIVGLPPHHPNDFGLPSRNVNSLYEESDFNGDLVIAGFLDTYDNNTYKTISALRWAKEICNDFLYLLLIDDDMYISLKNLVSYLANRVDYEINFASLRNRRKKEFTSGAKEDLYREEIQQKKEISAGTDLHKGKLFLGKMMRKAKPLRNQYGRGSKWFVSIDEYPYNFYPPYITGMAIVFSRATVVDFVYASLFTRHLYIDDVYLGILAHKLHLEPLDSKYFCLECSWENVHGSLEYMIAIHKFTPQQLIDIWANITGSIGSAAVAPYLNKHAILYSLAIVLCDVLKSRINI